MIEGKKDRGKEAQKERKKEGKKERQKDRRIDGKKDRKKEEKKEGNKRARNVSLFFITLSVVTKGAMERERANSIYIFFVNMVNMYT